ncbi:MAG: hypothetical protein JKY37_28310 [Nannocystaceae bacterium]|nr:hypothetical protein [Nannocystaceae bacterium]
MRLSITALLLASGLCGACSVDAPKPNPAPKAVDRDAATDPDKTTSASVDPVQPDLREEETQLIAPGVTIPKRLPNGIPILTPMDFADALIDMETATPAQRRKRAFARRKLIMNNPDSPAARALNDIAAAQRAGELDGRPKDGGVVFSVRGSKPTSGRPPAGWRPPADETAAANGQTEG